jgi:hypothetical protein
MPPPKKIPLLIKKSKKPKAGVKVKIIEKTVPTVVEPPSQEAATEPAPPSQEAATEPAPPSQEATTEPVPPSQEAATQNARDVQLDSEVPSVDEKKYVLLTPEKKEEYTDKLETKKHELKKAYKKRLSQGKDVSGLKSQLKEASRLLSEIKKCDAVTDIALNVEDKEKLEKDFEKKYKKLSMTDFDKFINLTAPKDERKPDISTEQIWHRSKDVIFKNKTYRDAPVEKAKKFTNKMKLKAMPKHIKKDLRKRTHNNTRAINMHTNQKDKLSYQQYDPLTFNGLNIY